MLTKGAIGNLINRYKAVLKKCRLLNAFGSLAAAALLVGGISSAAPAATIGSISSSKDFSEDTIVTANRTTESSDRLAGIFAENSQSAQITVSGGATLTVNNSDLTAAYTRLYGVVSQSGCIVAVTGNLNINIEAQENQQSRLIRGNGGKITLNGTVSASSTGGSGVVVGAEAWYGSKVTLEGDKTDSSIKEASGSIYGVQSCDTKSLMEFKADETTLGIEAATGATLVQGVYTHEATTTFTGNTTITIQGAAAETLGINAEGDATDDDDSVVNFSGANTSIHVESTNNVYAVTPSGGKSSVNFTGKTATIEAVSDGGTAAGILSQYGGNVHASADMDITATNSSGEAVGILLTSYAGYAGNADFTGNLSVSSSVSGNSNAFGIYNSTSNASAGLEDNGHLSVSGKTTINVSSYGNAYGLYGQGEYAKNTLSGSADILVSATTGNSFGIIGEDGAEITLGAEGTTGNITAESSEGAAVAMLAENGSSITSDGAQSVTAKSSSGDAVGLHAEGGQSRIGLGGDVTVTAASSTGSSTAILVEDGAEVTLGAEGTTGSITAEGAGSTAVALTGGSSLSLAGTNSLSAETALADDGTGLITNSGSLSILQGTVSGFSGSYVQTSGSTWLGESSGFFGGDVVIEKGVLAVNMADLGGVIPHENQALLALGNAITIADGSTLTIGTVDASNAATAAFGSDSVLVVNGLASSRNAMITAENGGSLFVADGAQLYIANAQAGSTYIITAGLDVAQQDYWDTANILGNRLIQTTISLSEGKVIISTAPTESVTALPGILVPNILNAMTTGNLNNTEASSMGIRFLSRAMDETFITPDTLAAATVNEVSRAAVTAGVQNTALRLAEASADQLMQHLSLSFFDKDGAFHRDGVDVWATPLYGNTRTHGMTASGASVRGNYGGLVLGADAQVGEVLGGRVRAGAAVHGGGGRSETRGTATSTKNDYNFGGVSLYAGWNLDNLNIMAGLGFTVADHDVKMSLPASLGMNRAGADVNTDAFTADLRAEYQIRTSAADIMPHAGVRYTALHTGSHDLTVDGGNLNHAASDTQHIVQFPVGVSVTKNIDADGWTVKPRVDVSVIPVAGEKKNTTRVSYAGIDAMDCISTRIMDSTSFSGMAGLQAEKGNLALGLHYGVQASRHETDQRVSVGISWKF